MGHEASMVNGYSRAAYAANKYTGMSPERLVLAMFDGALRFIEQAVHAIEEKDIAKKGESISKAVAVVAELQSALNPQAGELTEQLEALYDYVLRTLAKANIESDPKQLSEARSLMLVLRDGWATMLEGEQPANAPAAPPREAARGLAKGYL
jgi:flagellar protein FliS